MRKRGKQVGHSCPAIWYAPDLYNQTFSSVPRCSLSEVKVALCLIIQIMFKINENGEREIINSLFPTQNLKKINIKNEAAFIRREWVDRCSKLVNRPYTQMARLLQGWPIEWIKEIYETSKGFEKNPQALFWKLYKKHKVIPT